MIYRQLMGKVIPDTTRNSLFGFGTFKWVSMALPVSVTSVAVKTSAEAILLFSDHIIFVDESGDHSLKSIDPQYPIFALAFCIIR